MMHFIFLPWQLVVIVDPHIKADPMYALYSQGKDKGYFVKDRNGQDFEGICWPGKKKKVVRSAFQAVNFKNFAKMGAIKVELISHNTFFFF